MLALSRKPGESVVIGDNIEVMVSEMRHSKVVLAISAPSDVKILRKELVGKTLDQHDAPLEEDGGPASPTLLCVTEQVPLGCDFA